MEIISPYSQVPIRYDVEDEIFIICMSETDEFPQYISNFNDIVGRYDNRLISSDFKNLSLDSVRQRLNGNLINIEHHSSISAELMRRDYQYSVALHSNTGRYVHPFIFYTGDLPIRKVDHLNDLMFFNPNWFIAKEVEGTIRYNGFLHMKEEQIELNVYDCFDLIWLPKYNTNMGFEECILKCVCLLKDLVMGDRLRNMVERCYLLWVGKYIKDKEKLGRVQEVLSMSALKVRPFEEQLRDALMSNVFEQGINQTERKFIPGLLKSKSPEEISEEFDIPLKRVLKYVE